MTTTLDTPHIVAGGTACNAFQTTAFEAQLHDTVAIHTVGYTAPLMIREGDLSQRRLVKVFIVDPNPNVPPERAVLFEGQQTLTDLTDQELFFEIDLKGALERHNAYRVGLVDKTIRDREQKLEPVRIRDLAMRVVVLAQF